MADKLSDEQLEEFTKWAEEVAYSAIDAPTKQYRDIDFHMLVGGFSSLQLLFPKDSDRLGRLFETLLH